MDGSLWTGRLRPRLALLAVLAALPGGCVSGPRKGEVTIRPVVSEIAGVPTLVAQESITPVVTDGRDEMELFYPRPFALPPHLTTESTGPKDLVVVEQQIDRFKVRVVKDHDPTGNFIAGGSETTIKWKAVGQLGRPDALAARRGMTVLPDAEVAAALAAKPAAVVPVAAKPNTPDRTVPVVMPASGPPVPAFDAPKIVVPPSAPVVTAGPSTPCVDPARIVIPATNTAPIQAPIIAVPLVEMPKPAVMPEVPQIPIVPNALVPPANGFPSAAPVLPVIPTVTPPTGVR